MHGFVSSRSTQSPASSPLLRPTRSPATTASNAGQKTTQALLFKFHRFTLIFSIFLVRKLYCAVQGARRRWQFLLTCLHFRLMSQAVQLPLLYLLAPRATTVFLNIGDTYICESMIISIMIKILSLFLSYFYCFFHVTIIITVSNFYYHYFFVIILIIVIIDIIIVTITIIIVIIIIILTIIIIIIIITTTTSVIIII
jgi:hypothetical protein